MTIRQPQPRKLTYRDYLAFPSDRNRHEILDGEHAVSPSPVPYHQIVLVRLCVQLHLAIAEKGLGLVLPAPCCVQLSAHDIVEPDIIVLLGDRTELVTRTRIRGAPSLLIEVLAPSTRGYDKDRKKARYEKNGVPEYWIVDPELRQVEQWCLDGGGYRLAATETERVRLAGPPGVEIDLTRVW